MKGDKSIPFWIYLLVGIVMIIVSWLVDSKAEVKKMAFFILVGVVFMIVGAIKGIHYKLVVEHNRRSPPVKKGLHPGVARPAHQGHAVSHQAPMYHHASPAVHTEQQSHQPQHHVHHKPATHKSSQAFPSVRCHKCNAKLHPRFRFCPGCGAKIR